MGERRTRQRVKLVPYIADDGIPFCSADCPQYVENLTLNGKQHRRLPWKCAVEDDQVYGICRPMVRRWAKARSEVK